MPPARRSADLGPRVAIRQPSIGTESRSSHPVIRPTRRRCSCLVQTSGPSELGAVASHEIARTGQPCFFQLMPWDGLVLVPDSGNDS